MLRALSEYVVEGVPTLVGFHRALLETPEFAAGETCRDLVESPRARGAGRGARPERGGDRRGSRGRRLPTDEPPWAELARRRRAACGAVPPRPRRGREPDPGDGARGRGDRRRRRRSRPARLCRRGDEDGERGARSGGRHGLRADGRARRAGACGRRALRRDRGLERGLVAPQRARAPTPSVSAVTPRRSARCSPTLAPVGARQLRGARRLRGPVHRVRARRRAGSRPASRPTRSASSRGTSAGSPTKLATAITVSSRRISSANACEIPLKQRRR